MHKEKTMTKAILIAKSMVSEIENIRESAILSKAIEAVEFITLLTLPILLPLGIMIISSNGY